MFHFMSLRSQEIEMNKWYNYCQMIPLLWHARSTAIKPVGTKILQALDDASEECNIKIMSPATVS